MSPAHFATITWTIAVKTFKSKNEVKRRQIYRSHFILSITFLLLFSSYMGIEFLQVTISQAKIKTESYSYGFAAWLEEFYCQPDFRVQLTAPTVSVPLPWHQFILDFCLDRFSCRLCWFNHLVWRKQFVFQFWDIFCSLDSLSYLVITPWFHVVLLLGSQHQHFGQLMECTHLKSLLSWLLLRFRVKISVSIEGNFSLYLFFLKLFKRPKIAKSLWIDYLVYFSAFSLRTP